MRKRRHRHQAAFWRVDQRAGQSIGIEAEPVVESNPDLLTRSDLKPLRQRLLDAPLGFYRQFKELAITGYFTSEPIGKQLLTYDPVPGAFHGCIPADAKTRVSALG